MTRYSLAVFLGLCIALATAGAEPVTLDLPAALEAAREGNPEVREERIALQAAERRYAFRGAVFLPSADVAASAYSTEADMSAWGAGLSADLTFRLSAGGFSTLRRAPIDLQTARTAYDTTLAETLRRVKKAFYSLLILRERESLLEGSIDSMKARYEAAQYDYEKGRVAEYEVLSARLSYLTLLPELEDFRIQAAASREAFLQLLGLPADTEFSLRGSVEVEAPVPGGEAVLPALGEHGSLRILELRKMQQEEALRALYDRYYPSLTLGAGLDLTFPEPGSLQPSAGPGGRYYSLTLSVDLTDFLPFSPMAEGITAAEEALEVTRLNIASASRGLTASVTTLLEKIKKAEQDMDVYRFNLELAEEYYRIVTAEYESGRQDILALEEADLKLQRARVDLLSKKAAYIDLLIDLEYYTGTALLPH